MGTPRFGGGGLPMFGLGGLPLACEEDEDCCEAGEPWECVGFGCTNGLVPYQALVTLPSVSHTDANQFNHAGGTFLLDFYGSTSIGGSGSPVGAPIGANTLPEIQDNVGLTSVGSCGYMGPIIGTHCGANVRPFAAYNWKPDGFSPAGRYLGFAHEVPPAGLNPSYWLTVPFLIAAGGGSTIGVRLRWTTDGTTSSTCHTSTFTQAYAGESNATARNCSGTGTFTYTIGAATLSLGPG